jgi:hypothetical protein
LTGLSAILWTAGSSAMTLPVAAWLAIATLVVLAPLLVLVRLLPGTTR